MKRLFSVSISLLKEKQRGMEMTVMPTLTQTPQNRQYHGPKNW
jgi:hypothetical protein